MRKNRNVQAGQLWRSSDPRRLRLIEVLSNPLGTSGKAFAKYGERMVIVKALYPLCKPDRVAYVPLRLFLTTGSKGLTRVKQLQTDCNNKKSSKPKMPNRVIDSASRVAQMIECYSLLTASMPCVRLCGVRPLLRLSESVRLLALTDWLGLAKVRSLLFASGVCVWSLAV